jgi:nucleoside-diphosphate-sugar epimerase
LRGEPPMTRFLAAQLARDHFFDITAAKTLLGYVPKVTTADGLHELQQHWLHD